jgi:hypothetical protein
MVVYICNWCGFEGCCEVKGVSPFQSSLVDILMFLQELFELGLFHMEGLYISHLGVSYRDLRLHPWVSSSGGEVPERRVLAQTSV